MKYRDNMTEEELNQFKRELQELDDAYASSAEKDKKNLPYDEWEDPSDYVGMGWVARNGRP